jgi:hypothetical protein
VKGKWPFYDVMNFFLVLFAAYKYGNVPEAATTTEVSLTDQYETETGISEQLEGENIIT